MKVAIPVHGESLKVFGNAGHTPFFAVFSIGGAGPFKSFKLEELRANPRANPDHEEECSAEKQGHECSHGGEDALAHKEEHRTMANLLSDCEFLLVSKACKNTKLVMEEAGVKVKKLPPILNANEAVGVFLKELP